MTWLVWRQHRAQFAVGAALLAALAVLLLITGLQMAAQYHSAIVACTAAHSCRDQGGLFLGNHAVGFLVIMTLGTPVLVGLFWGAPLVAAELENGSSPFAWTQSVTRSRWLAVKLTLVGLCTMAVAGLLSLMATWWSSPVDRVNMTVFASFDQRAFLKAQVGVEELYNTCPSMFTCGTPYASTAGSEIQAKSNMRNAQELLKASGYNGTPVVLMKPTDLDAIGKLERSGTQRQCRSQLLILQHAGRGMQDVRSLERCSYRNLCVHAASDSLALVMCNRYRDACAAAGDGLQ